MSKQWVLIERMMKTYMQIRQYFFEKKKVSDPRRQALIKEVQMSDEEAKLIDSFFRDNYGRMVPHDWHKLYQSFTGQYHYEYFPELLFSSRVEPRFNPWTYRYVLDDKLLLPLFTIGVDNVKTPSLIGGYANGVYFNNEHTTLTKEGFVDALVGIGDCIFKKTNDTDSGRGVQIFSFEKETSIEEIEAAVNSFCGSSFVVQKIVQPHKTLADIYPNSVNTFRIVTYVLDGKIYHFPVTLRIGRNGNRVDNAHAGGIFVGLTDDGKFKDAAFTEFRDTFYKHPDTGFVFKGASLPYISEMIETAERMHINALCLGMISWDLTVDVNGTFILIEANTNGQTVWFPQMATGQPAFGDNTAAILNRIRR